MLPGLRFFAVATVLTLALLTFGVGAAALLRATHQVAGLPWQPPQPVLFVGHREAATPTLSLLRIEPQPDEPATAAADDEMPMTTPPAAAGADDGAGTVADMPAGPADAKTGAVAAKAEFPAPPEPVVRDATADVLAALPPAAATAEPAAPRVAEPATSEESGAGSRRTPDEEAASLPVPVVADAPPTTTATAWQADAVMQTAALPEPASAPEPETVAATPADMPDISGTPDVPADAQPWASITAPDSVEAVPGAVVAHPPLPRERPSDREIAARKAAAIAATQRARAAAARRRQAAMRPPAPAAPPQPRPFASPFGQQFGAPPAFTPGR